ncbi:unnamed protein product [Closterium sp. Yama58-4]|nr:unnamed protein product [Closterium sp. Yama58-4]
MVHLGLESPSHSNRQLPHQAASLLKAVPFVHYAVLVITTSTILAFWVAFPQNATYLPADCNHADLPVERPEVKLQNCPRCDERNDRAPSDELAPLDRPLTARGAKIRMCMGSPSAPFAQGTFVTKPMKHGKAFHNRFAQLTVFEAEVRHEPELWAESEARRETSGGTTGGESSGTAAGEGGTAGGQGGQQAETQGGNHQGGQNQGGPGRPEPTKTTLRLLSFLEDDDSIRKSQWQGWGEAEYSDLFSPSVFKVQCHVWPTHDAYMQTLEPAYIVDAVANNSYLWHNIIECPLPPYVELSTGNETVSSEPASSAAPPSDPSAAPAFMSGRERLGTAEGRKWAVHHWQQVQVQLVAAEEGADLRMPPLLLCRADSDKHTLASSPLSLSLTSSLHTAAAAASAAAAQPFPFGGCRAAAEAAAQAAAKGAKGGSGGLAGSKPAVGLGSGSELVRFLAEGEKGANGTYKASGGEMLSSEDLLVNYEDAASNEDEFGSSSSSSSSIGRSASETGEGGRTTKHAGMGAVSICLRPVHKRQMFSDNVAVSDVRLIEWIDACLLMGVNRIYVYDRYATHIRALLWEYIARGQVVHVPFPNWSEVFFRQAQYDGKAKKPYAFPDIYDQVIAFEHCMMLGRRFGDRWQLQIDSDEFIWYHPQAGGFLKPLLARIEVNHARAPGSKQPLRAILIRRFNFWGVKKESRGDPVSDRLQWRCREPMWHTKTWVGWHDKVAVNPQTILPYSISIHNTFSPPEEMATAPPSILHLNHYTSREVDLKEPPCNATVKPIEDASLFWARNRTMQCRAVRCGGSGDTPVECWPFCQLPWVGQ